MAETLLSFGVEKLWKLLVRESERFRGVEEQFNGLKSDVEMLRCFLEDAEAKRHTSAMVRNTIKEIREIVFDAEDIVETFVLKEELGNTSGIRNSMRRFSCVILERRGLAFEMKAISKRISKVIRDMQNLSVHKVIVNEGYTESLQEIHREMRQTFSSDNEDHLVGLEKNVEILVGYLMDEDSSQVVSIIGMGGIGKTTLARKVFNNERIKSHFPGLAWVCLSQQFTRKDVSQTILQQLRSEVKVFEMTDDVLQEKLVGVLETQKTLIVVDDIWKERDWERIKHVSIPKKGWKVLLTSRNEGVGLHADPKCVTFKPECLTFEDSWNLFQKKAFPMKDTTIDEEMEEMGKEMIKHCGGLPLAVKVLGGLLAAQYTLHQWKRIHENIKAHIVGETSFNDKNTGSVFHVLYLSFEELPVYLKHCFLHLAHFPEDYEISVEDLSYHLAAEGIPRPRHYDGASIRDVGDGYIEELVKRNMVISERNVHTSRFEKCQLHDMMREVCLRKAEEENFLQIIQRTSTANSTPYKSRRLAVHWLEETFNAEKEVTNPSLRTLLCIESRGLKPTRLFFTRHKLMRVLNLSRANFEGGKIPSSIGELINLRYLSLYEARYSSLPHRRRNWSQVNRRPSYRQNRAHVIHLPSSMENLKQLLYLNLDVDEGVLVDMPNILKEMRELTYLYMPSEKCNLVKLEMGNLVNLETLKNFSPRHVSVRDLQGMTRLRTLSIYPDGNGCTEGTLSSSLSKSTHLESLTIVQRHASTNYDEEGFVFDCVHLRELLLKIYMPRLPDKIHFASHLTIIYLKYCCLKEDPMPILEKLPHLEEMTLGERSFCGRRMICSRGGFPQLPKLQISGLKEWEEWIIEEGSMPLLHTLSIVHCKKLKELPYDLRFITSLENVQVCDLSLEFQFRKRTVVESKKKILCLPSHLTTISLTGFRLDEDLMPILEKGAHLKEVSLTKISFSGRRMVCSMGGFPQLQTLKLCELKELEEWVVEEGSMPLLHTLRINDCKELKEIPDGLRFITSLETLHVSNISQENLQVDRTGEERKKVLSLPSHLTTITLYGCGLEEDPMPILEKLSQLQKVRLGTQSFCWRRMVCSKGGFPQLQELKIEGLEELEEWIVEEDSMPLLSTLYIKSCKKLKELPDGLRFVTSLKDLTCRGMGEEWKERLSEEGADYSKVQHIPSVIVSEDIYTMHKMDMF